METWCIPRNARPDLSATGFPGIFYFLNMMCILFFIFIEGVQGAMVSANQVAQLVM